MRLWSLREIEINTNSAGGSRAQVDELQKRALGDAQGDPQLEEFDRELYEVDTGDAALQQFGVPDKAAVIRDLIEMLKNELEGEK